MDLALYAVNVVLVEGRSVRGVAAATGARSTKPHQSSTANPSSRTPKSATTKSTRPAASPSATAHASTTSASAEPTADNEYSSSSATSTSESSPPTANNSDTSPSTPPATTNHTQAIPSEGSSVPETPRQNTVETMGLEPTTPCLQSRCSSQLSYVPGARHSTTPAPERFEQLDSRGSARTRLPTRGEGCVERRVRRLRHHDDDTSPFRSGFSPSAGLLTGLED